ncbi:MAG: Rpn family recombination-promoting nuclease/putative transposase [Saprospiraceae bacterium]|nr:Rpn family recombination-promoting nuclease/putative transposase [Saprospiraceae bacterium]
MNELGKLNFIPFTSDYGFKVTFGNEKNTVFLKRALQALLKLPHKIEEITFLKNTFDGLIKDSRSGIFDVLCTDEIGNTFIVEMQGIAKEYFLNRMQFYAFQSFDTLVRKGKFDFNIKEKIYCIAILGTNIHEVESYHNIISLKNQDGVAYPSTIQYVTVELEKFSLSADKVKSDLEKLIFTIKNAHIMAEIAEKPAFWEEDWLKIPIGELDIRTLSPDRYRAYQYWLVNQAEIEREKEETQKLIVKSKTEGKIEGIIEGKIEIIKELLKEGLLPINSIAKVAHVTEAFVLDIQEKLKKEPN